MRPFPEYGAPIGFLLLAGFLYFRPVLAQGQTMIVIAPRTDTWDQFFFWRYLVYAHLARGEMPLWNSHICSGTPFLGGLQSAIFCSPNLIHLLAPTAMTNNFNIALYCLLPSSLTCLCARQSGCSR